MSVVNHGVIMNWKNTNRLKDTLFHIVPITGPYIFAWIVIKIETKAANSDLCPVSLH